MSLIAELSLAELRIEFARWRETRCPRHVPTPLQENTVALLSTHSTSELLKTLGINHQMLKRWRRRYGDEPTQVSAPLRGAFVPLEAGEEPRRPAAERFDSMLKITRQTPDGTALSVEGQLTLSQWRVAITLLQTEAVAR